MKTFDQISSEMLAKVAPQELREINERISLEKGLLAIAVSVREARTLRGMSQQELADKANLTQGEISRIETGRFSPRLETLMKLAQALETSFTISPVESAA